uniref:Glycerol-3-phosphate acyltransferase n=1 Tax=candidate division WOR-3 bacterium TaxID=2052148 RepID=A0A7C4YBL7_UNCW3
MKIILLFLISFFSGSLMFSYWLGRIKGIDLRNVRDGNPGAFNLWHSAGPLLGFTGIVLDFLKGFLPVFIFYKNGFIDGWEIIPVGIAPLLGHIFSPFLSFKGGKGIDTSFGIWAGISIFKSLTLAIFALIFFLIIKFILRKELSSQNSTLIIIPCFILFTFYTFFFKDMNLIILSILNTGIIIYKHWKDFIFIWAH